MLILKAAFMCIMICDGRHHLVVEVRDVREERVVVVLRLQVVGEERLEGAFPARLLKVGHRGPVRRKGLCGT